MRGQLQINEAAGRGLRMNTISRRAGAVTAPAHKMNRKRIRRFIPVYLIMLPGLIYLFINNYMPMPGLIVAFKQYNIKKGIYGSAWVGLKNFEYLGKDPVSWYSEPKYWPFIIIFISAWKSVGYNCIIYLSSIMGIDRSIYESASIDGASKWQQIKFLTLPLLKPTIIMLTLMAIGRIFYSDFGMFYQVPMNQGALYSTTNTIDTYVYRGLIQIGNISMSAAAGVYQSVVGFVLVLLANLAVRKFDKENALI